MLTMKDEDVLSNSECRFSAEKVSESLSKWLVVSQNPQCAISVRVAGVDRTLASTNQAGCADGWNIPRVGSTFKRTYRDDTVTIRATYKVVSACWSDNCESLELNGTLEIIAHGATQKAKLHGRCSW